VADIFAARYPEYQYRVVQFLIEHLADVNQAFKGDLLSSLVLAVIGQVWISAGRGPGGTYVDPSTLPLERLCTSATRIADVTGISRQTVRRKLDALEARGWIVRNADSTYCLASTGGETAARRDLSETDVRALRRVARLFSDLEKIVRAGEADEAARGEIGVTRRRGPP
jgi:hypothetical protein